MNARERLIVRELSQRFKTAHSLSLEWFATSIYCEMELRWSQKRRRGIYHKPPWVVGRWKSRKLTRK